MSKLPPSDSETRLNLILAGERLIGDSGIEGVSLRQVNTAAGQRNKSAAHYHFGTKLGLLEAIYDYRMERVNIRREQMLEQVGHDIEDFIAAWVFPMVDEMSLSEGGSHYIRFISKVCTHPDNNIRRLMDSRHASGMQRIASGLREQLVDLPGALFGMRFGLAMVEVIQVLAELERLKDISSNVSVSSALYVSNLVDVLVASFRAPVSSTTRRELTGDRYRTAG